MAGVKKKVIGKFIRMISDGKNNLMLVEEPNGYDKETTLLVAYHLSKRVQAVRIKDATTINVAADNLELSLRMDNSLGYI